MLKNYLTVAVRNLTSHKLYSAINVVGLAVAMAGCVVIGTAVLSEVGWDTHNEKADRICRVVRETGLLGSHYVGVGTSGALAGARGRSS